MNTYSELSDLQTYIKKNVGLDVKIGQVDKSIQAYPIIFIIPDENGNFTEIQGKTLNSFDFNLKIKLIDVKDRLIKTFQYMDKLINKMNSFAEGKGHKFETDIITEFVNDNYEVTFKYKLKIRLQNI